MDIDDQDIIVSGPSSTKKKISRKQVGSTPLPCPATNTFPCFIEFDAIASFLVFDNLYTE